MDKAVAIKYTPDVPAPFILAKGKNAMAEIIIKIAKENGIEIMNIPDLAESLIEIDEGALIPEEYYHIIAKILVFVQNL
jgi:type III secretion system FlhB-like substrate exporter